MPFSDACERNKEPILGVLRDALSAPAQVLEIGSGTGQHAVYFAAQLPHLNWQPTEQLAHLEALNARILAEAGPNVAVPTVLDVFQSLWPGADAVFTANTLHIMSWPHVIALFAGVARTLAEHGRLLVYGPFRYGGDYTSPSNRDFDAMLRRRDPRSGIRDVEAIAALAEGHGFRVTADHDLPAFNRLLVIDRQ